MGRDEVNHRDLFRLLLAAPIAAMLKPPGDPLEHARLHPWPIHPAQIRFLASVKATMRTPNVRWLHLEGQDRR